jgi:hypothetical protein
VSGKLLSRERGRMATTSAEERESGRRCSREGESLRRRRKRERATSGATERGESGCDVGSEQRAERDNIEWERVKEEESDENQWRVAQHEKKKKKEKKKRRLEAEAYTEVEQEEQGEKRKEKKKRK